MDILKELNLVPEDTNQVSFQSEDLPELLEKVAFEMSNQKSEINHDEMTEQDILAIAFVHADRLRSLN
jgi:hypothetical protein